MIPSMASRFRGSTDAMRLWRRLAAEIGDELRAARILAGTTQRHRTPM